MFTLTIKTDNTAFEDPGDECAKILRAVVGKLEDGHRNGVLFDTNGNRVGKWALTGRR